jgi:SAM-dependent methyltransferase
MDIPAIYRHRFEATGLEKRKRIWAVLCRHFFDPLIGPDRDVLDLGCGYGEFVNHVVARSKVGVDMNPDCRQYLAPDVKFVQTPATHLAAIDSESVDVVFTSNFLEHLKSKAECDLVLAEVRRVLRPLGRFIVLGPNVRYVFREYWDFYDHHLPLSHLSLEEGLTASGFKVVRNVPRFLPYTMRSRLPTPDFLIRLYLAFPPAWRWLGKQFLIVAEKAIFR